VLAGCAAPSPAPAPPTTTTVVPATTTTTAPAQLTGAQARDRLLVLVNSERAARGLPSLVARVEIEDIASRWSADMATAGEISHNDAYFDTETRARLHARAMGENVARNVDVEHAHASLMASEHHRANILDVRFDQVGFGAVLHDGSWWVTEDFVQARQAANAAPRTAPVHASVERPSGVASRPPMPAPLPAALIDGGEVLAASTPMVEVMGSTPTTVTLDDIAPGAAAVGVDRRATTGVPALAVLLLAAVIALWCATVRYRVSCSSAAVRTRWRCRPWRTSSGCASPVRTIVASSAASVANASAPTALAQSSSRTPFGP
jgi:hypothetical protein